MTCGRLAFPWPAIVSLGVFGLFGVYCILFRDIRGDYDETKLHTLFLDLLKLLVGHIAGMCSSTSISVKALSISEGDDLSKYFAAYLTQMITAVPLSIILMLLLASWARKVEVHTTLYPILALRHIGAYTIQQSTAGVRQSLHLAPGSTSPVLSQRTWFVQTIVWAALSITAQVIGSLTATTISFLIGPNNPAGVMSRGLGGLPWTCPERQILIGVVFKGVVDFYLLWLVYVMLKATDESSEPVMHSMHRLRKMDQWQLETDSEVSEHESDHDILPDRVF